MQLNALGKIFFTAVGATVAVRVAEYAIQGDPQPASAEELLGRISNDSVGFLVRLAMRNDWDGFNRSISSYPRVMAASHQQRCAMWELCRQ